MGCEMPTPCIKCAAIVIFPVTVILSASASVTYNMKVNMALHSHRKYH